MGQLNIEFTSEIVSSYRRLSYKVWYALAEFVDNSTQAYFNNKSTLDEVYDQDGSGLEVFIDYHRGSQISDDYFKISDNSIGMDADDLRAAFKIGTPPPNPDGRSRYGLGMKTASFWLGDTWSITTSKLGCDKKCTVRLDVNEIAEGNLQIEIVEEPEDVTAHYTHLEIHDLHRRFKGRTLGKIKDFLASIYRFDIMSGELKIYWNHEAPLSWEQYSDEDFIQSVGGNAHKREFEFEIGGKSVHGWAGALASGSRAKSGFSLIQAKRVIQGPPQGYKPESIFGDQEGGINNLINQRIVGELYLEGFKVSHTKDSILWEGTEEDDLSDELLARIGELRQVAEDFRARGGDDRGPTDVDVDIAVDSLFNEISSSSSQNVIFDNELPSSAIIATSNRALAESILVDEDSAKNVNVGSLRILLFVKSDMSPNDPYVIHDPVSQPNTVAVIVNKRHPFWNELEGDRGVLNYLRQCVYDGVAEWKAFERTGEIRADAVKYIKDDLMRVPYEYTR